MAQIQAKWSKYSLETPILAWGPSFWPFGHLDQYWGLRYLGSDQIWTILPGFGPLCFNLGYFCLDLGHIAWIWALWQKGVISAQISQTIKPKKIDFAHFWCTDSPSGDMQKSRIFLLYAAYFGFYGGLKFGPPGVPPNLWKAITWPVVELERQSWCQSSSFGPKNLIQQKKWSNFFFEGWLPLGVVIWGTPGYLVRWNLEKFKLKKKLHGFLYHIQK